MNLQHSSAQSKDMPYIINIGAKFEYRDGKKIQ